MIENFYFATPQLFMATFCAACSRVNLSFPSCQEQTSSGFQASSSLFDHNRSSKPIHGHDADCQV